MQNDWLGGAAPYIYTPGALRALSHGLTRGDENMTPAPFGRIVLTSV